METQPIYKLGRIKSRKDPRTLLLSKYLTGTLPPTPASVDWTSKVKNWPMMANDKLGDCTIAAAGHMIELWTAWAIKHTIILPDAQIIKAYSAVSGYDPATGANDNGCQEIDVLNYWRKNGIGGRKILGFAQVNLKNRAHLMAALNLFGAVYTGIALPLSAQGQRNWSVPQGGATGNGAPGSWGGHAVPIVKADPSAAIVVSWGSLLPMSWDFWSAYGEEAWAVISEDWINAGKAPNGFDLQALLNDLKLVTN